MTWTDFVVRGTLVLAAGFAASFAFGRASAALRHFVWTAAFLALLAIAVGASPRAEDRAGRLAGGAGRAGCRRRAWRPPLAPACGNRQRIESWPRGSDAGPSPPGVPGALWRMLYLAGLLLVAARFLAGAVRTARLVRQARPAPMRRPGGQPAPRSRHRPGCAFWKVPARPCP
jgi:hypothetical protein